MCEPDDHSDYLVHCQGFLDASNCEGKKTCSIEVSSRNYIQCANKKYAPTYFFVKYTCTQSKFFRRTKQEKKKKAMILCFFLLLLSSHDVCR